MSILRVITRIIPSTAQDEAHANLMVASEIDTPYSTEWSSTNEDPTSAIALVAETTFCKENVVPPGVDLNKALISKCQEINGLVCLKDNLSLSENKNIVENSTFAPLFQQGPIIKIASSACSNGMLVSIPLRISRNNIPSPSVGSANSDADHSIPLNVSVNNIANSSVVEMVKSNAELNLTPSNNIQIASIFGTVNFNAEHNQCNFNEKEAMNEYVIAPVHPALQGRLCEMDVSGREMNLNTEHQQPIIQTQVLKEINSNSGHQQINFQKQAAQLALSGSTRMTHSGQHSHVVEENELTLVGFIEPIEKYFRGNTCLLCGFVSSAKTLSNTRLHLATHLDEKEFKCEVCDKTFTTPDYFLMHKKTHVEDLSLSSDQCSKKFNANRKLLRHKRTHGKKEIECHICKAKLMTQQSLKNHLTIHTGELPYQCSECSTRFRTVRGMRLHSLKHTGENKYICKICNKEYNTNSLYKQHLNTHKNGEGLYKCDECEKTFNYPSCLLQHKPTHTELRKHACTTCGKTFKFFCSFIKHIATHDISESAEMIE